MTAPGALIARNAKTVVSSLGGVINVLAVSAALFQFAPASVAGVGSAAVAVLEALRGVNVWIVKNEPAIEAAADQLAGGASTATGSVAGASEASGSVPGAGA